MEVDGLLIDTKQIPNDKRTAADILKESVAVVRRETNRDSSMSPDIFDDTDGDPGVGEGEEFVEVEDDVANAKEGLVSADALKLDENSHGRAGEPKKEGEEAKGDEEEKEEEEGGGKEEKNEAQADAAHKGANESGANESGANEYDANKAPGWAIIGTKVRKDFGGIDYEGKVTSFDTDLGFYRVVYNDGDDEDLDLSEILAIAIPLGVESDSKKKRGRKRKVVGEIGEGGDANSGDFDGKRRKAVFGGANKEFEVRDLPDWLPEGWRVTEKSKKRVSR